MRIPSRGIYWQDLGMVGLGGVQPGTWSTLSFAVPTGLKETLQSAALQDIGLVLAANTSTAPVTFDSLRFLTPPPGNPPPPRPTAASPSASELGKPYTPRFLSCSTSTTTVLDVDAEFKDIWAGRETPWQGKRTSQTPKVGLRFSGPVNPTMVNASFFPTDANKCGTRIQAAGVTAPALWQGSSTTPSIGRLSASDYNAIVLSSVSGTPNSEGPAISRGEIEGPTDAVAKIEAEFVRRWPESKYATALEERLTQEAKERQEATNEAMRMSEINNVWYDVKNQGDRLTVLRHRLKWLQEWGPKTTQNARNIENMKAGIRLEQNRFCQAKRELLKELKASEYQSVVKSHCDTQAPVDDLGTGEVALTPQCRQQFVSGC